MAGYQTLEALRPILHNGPPKTPVLDRMLFYKPYRKGSPTLAQIKEMKALRSEGYSTRRIAEKVGLWVGQVHRHVRDVPVLATTPKLRVSGFTDKDRQKAARMRRAGFSYVEIGEDLQCSASYARRIVRGEERDRSVEIHTPINKILYAIVRVTGVERKSIRSTRQRGGKVPNTEVRARHIVFWLAVRRAGLSLTEAGRRLGFDHKTVANGVAIVDRASAGLTLPEDCGYARIARIIFEAEWPKASA